MSGAEFSIDNQVSIYHYFFRNTFPYFYITEPHFSNLMLKVGWKEEKIPKLFQSFKSKKNQDSDNK